MNKLTKVQRIRLDDQTVSELAKLSAYGLKQSKFIRDAIYEKLERDKPKILSDRKRKQALIHCPF